MNDCVLHKVPIALCHMRLPSKNKDRFLLSFYTSLKKGNRANGSVRKQIKSFERGMDTFPCP